MALFQFVLGNAIPRKGHRHDCAQARVTVQVKARNEEHAREKLADGKCQVVAIETGTPDMLAGVPCEEIG